MPDKSFAQVSLSDYRGKYVVLFFYPFDFTFVCPTEIIAFGDRQPEFTAINTQVIAASCDSKFTHLAWVNTPRSEGGLGDMKIPILADFTKEVAHKYGVVIPSGGDAGAPLRGLFVIDPTGTLRQITCNDLPVGRNVDEVLRLIQAFQFVEKHGEVCPANWQPGDRTMNADPTLSKSYFAAVNPGSSSAGGASSGSLVENVADRAAFNKAVGGAGLTVVDYWAPWCGNCKKISPAVDKMAADHPNIKFIKVNTNAGSEGEDIGIEHGVDALPTFQFFRAGKKVGEFKGSAAPALLAAIQQVA